MAQPLSGTVLHKFSHNNVFLLFPSSNHQADIHSYPTSQGIVLNQQFNMPVSIFVLSIFNVQAKPASFSVQQVAK